MGIRLVRESSTIPNITNRDDARMVNYAYGGYEGIVKDFGEELAYTAQSGVFHIGSGRVVLQGWEVDVEIDGWQIDLSTVVGTQYYTVYLEINLVTEIASIKTLFASGTYPEVDKGDNLTAYPSGTGRLVLYQVMVTDGDIVEVNPVVTVMKHIKERLDELGFREGELTPFAVNSQGEMTQLEFASGTLAPSISLTKQGKHAILYLYVSFSSSFSASLPSEAVSVRFYLPREFYAVTVPGPISLSFIAEYSNTLNGALSVYSGSISHGEYIEFPYKSIFESYRIVNFGWRTV